MKKLNWGDILTNIVMIGIIPLCFCFFILIGVKIDLASLIFWVIMEIVWLCTWYSQRD